MIHITLRAHENILCEGVAASLRKIAEKMSESERNIRASEPKKTTVLDESSSERAEVCKLRRNVDESKCSGILFTHTQSVRLRAVVSGEKLTPEEK